MKTRTMWIWENASGDPMACYPTRKSAKDECVRRGHSHMDRLGGFKLTPKARWRMLRKEGHKLVRVRGVIVEDTK